MLCILCTSSYVCMHACMHACMYVNSRHINLVFSVVAFRDKHLWQDFIIVVPNPRASISDPLIVSHISHQQARPALFANCMHPDQCKEEILN